MRTRERRTRGRPWVDGDPVTLLQAEDVLRRQRPAMTASADQWRAYHENAVLVYHAVAELDTDHQHEALALAWLARDDAEKIGGAVSPVAGKPD